MKTLRENLALILVALIFIGVFVVAVECDNPAPVKPPEASR
jgi:hypothetical protein